MPKASVRSRVRRAVAQPTRSAAAEPRTPAAAAPPAPPRVERVYEPDLQREVSALLLLLANRRMGGERVEEDRAPLPEWGATDGRALVAGVDRPCSGGAPRQPRRSRE
jgi:hypothetical protein